MAYTNSMAEQESLKKSEAPHFNIEIQNKEASRSMLKEESDVQSATTDRSYYIDSARKLDNQV
jgi:hypothetical protein